jgi:flagellar biosynthetic protein FliQ
MQPEIAIDIGRQALIVTLIISSPILVAGLVVGVVIGVLQAVTQIHEMTLTFIPKILIMVAVFLAMMPWMMITLVDYTTGLFDMIPLVVK